MDRHVPALKERLGNIEGFSRLCGINLLPEEDPGWFPEDKLRAFYKLTNEDTPTTMQRMLLGFRDDGTEGLRFSCGREDVDNAESKEDPGEAERIALNGMKVKEEPNV